MTNTTISAQLRCAQDELNNVNSLLESTRTLAQEIGLAPFRINHIQAAINDNQHAWQELNELATTLEITGADFREPPAAAPLAPGA